MINIRRSVFETNSSSMHSLVIVKNSLPYTDLELKFDVWNNDPEFNLFDYREEGVYERHPYRVLRTPLQKLQYYVAYTLGTCGKTEKIDEIKQFIHKHTNVPLDKIDLYHRESHCNRKGEWHETKDFGCVYENDTGEDVFHFVKRKGITMEDLILNPKYIIIVDGDEYELFKALFDSGIITQDNIEDISSGIDFWLGSAYKLPLSWLEKESFDPLSDEDISSHIDSSIKTLIFLIASETKEYYDAKRIKHIIDLTREKNPDLKVKLSQGYTNDEYINIEDLDTSMFDEIEVNLNFEEK